MKVTHINFDDSGGGAGIAAQRLHTGLKACGVDSRMAVAVKHGDSPLVHQQWSKFHQRIGQPIYNVIEKLPLRVLYSRPNNPAYASFPWLPTFRHQAINAMRHDIAHLHWISDGFISPHALAHIHPPAVWTIHDAWPFTGGCHYPGRCTQYTQQCGRCPQLMSHKRYDLSHLHWTLKRKAVERLRPVIVSPSRHYAQKARQSGLFRGCHVEHIPNGIDTTAFSPVEKRLARNLLHLPQDVPLLLFSAMNTEDHRKGFDLLAQALQNIQNAQQFDLHCLVVGASHSGKQVLPYPSHYLGRLHDTIALTLAYSAADMFICPSREDNLPNTILESMACGTAVVAFDVGGIADMVAHGKTGYIAQAEDPMDLAEGIRQLVVNSDHRQQQAATARRVVEQTFAIEAISQRYRNLYENILRDS